MTPNNLPEKAAEPTQRQIQLRIPDDVMKGHYANIVRIDVSPEEFIFSFGAINAQLGDGIITDRIFMNPSHVKRMIELMKRMMDHYEKSHGTVSVSEASPEIGFKTS